MKVCGIICEFNPFHNGHAHLISELRCRGAEIIICAMSGSFTQRGESAIADKFNRAAAAVAGGADLVLELPYPYSASGAEDFATGGVDLLARVGVDTLGFGSECGDKEKLTAMLDARMNTDFGEIYRGLCRDGHGQAYAYTEALRQCGAVSEPGANDILALAYMRAIRTRGLDIETAVVKRNGADYRSAELAQNVNPSAMALRRAWFDCGLESIKNMMPEGSYECLTRAEQDGLSGSRIKNIGRDIITYLRICDYSSNLPSDDLIPRIIRSARQATSLDELTSGAFASNFTDSRIRRTILDLLTRPTDSDRTAPPAYTQLLAANTRGRGYLSSIRHSSGIAIVTKPADASDVPGGERQYLLCDRADALWCMTLPHPKPADTLAKMHPVFSD